MFKNMFKDMTRAKLIRIWFAVIAVAVVIAVALGARITVSNAAVLLALCLAPPAIVLLLWPAYSPTVAEVLHDTDQGV
jgi:hypothetical protein